MNLSKEELTYVINHVFLPLKLPHAYDPDSPIKDVCRTGRPIIPVDPGN
jgi:hypothetical protein